LAALLAGIQGSAAEPASPSAPALRWTDVVAVLDRAGEPARDVPGLAAPWIGRPAELELEFVQEETDALAQKRHLYRHVEGRHVFLCYVQGAQLGRHPGWTGVVRARVEGLRLQHEQRRRRLYVVQLRAEPGPP
jgi:hypothetical protein